MLYGMFTIAPQMFGTSFLATPSQAAFRTFAVINCLALAIFFFAIAVVPTPNVGGAVRIVSALAAVTMTVENLPSALGTIRGVVPVVRETMLWRLHPLRQLGYFLGLTLPTLAGITLLVFLVAVLVRTLQTPSHAADQGNFLRLASFTVAAVFVIALIGTFFAVLMTPRPVAASTLRLTLRFGSLASFIAFFFVFGLNQHRSQISERTSALH